MTFTGHVKEGAIVLDEAVELPEGASVRVEVAPQESPADNHQASVSFAERYTAFIGVIEDLPEDWAQNHDRYLRDEHGA